VLAARGGRLRERACAHFADAVALGESEGAGEAATLVVAGSEAGE
jgi:hypothetical protein